MSGDPSQAQGTRTKRIALGVASLLVIAGASVLYAYSVRVCCAPPPLRLDHVSTRPADFHVTLDRSTGSLAPEFFHEIRVVIGKTGRSTVTVTRSHVDGAPQKSATFQVADTTRDRLWAFFRDLGLQSAPAPEAIPPEERRMGAGTRLLTITGDGRTTTLDPERREGDPWTARIVLLDSLVYAQIPDTTRRRLGIR